MCLWEHLTTPDSHEHDWLRGEEEATIDITSFGDEKGFSPSLFVVVQDTRKGFFYPGGRENPYLRGSLLY